MFFSNTPRMDYIKFNPRRDEIKTDSIRAGGLIIFVKSYAPQAHLVLDLGAGKGHLVAEFNKQGYDAFGIDLRTVFETDRSRFAVSDAKKLPFRDGTFDVVCQTFLDLDIADLQRDCVNVESEINNMLYETHRVLKPKGYFISLPPPDEKIMRFHGFENPDKRVNYAEYSPIYQKR
jgi:SAM-dependent methyltransferase